MTFAFGNEDAKSVFNAGVAQAERIDSLQRALNAARYNLRAFNTDVGSYNYEIMLNSIVSLFLEAWGKLNSEEKQTGEMIHRTIKEFLKQNPPIEDIHDGKMGNAIKTISIKNLDKLELLLIIFEKRVKEMLDAHSFNSPTREWDEGL